MFVTVACKVLSIEETYERDTKVLKGYKMVARQGNRFFFIYTKEKMDLEFNTDVNISGSVLAYTAGKNSEPIVGLYVFPDREDNDR